MKAGSIQSVERLDNGLMPRAVERLSNIEEIMDEREQKHSEETTELVLNEDLKDQGD